VVSLLKHSIFSFNEEMGELQFATLGHTVLGDNHQCHLTKLRDAFQAQPYLQAVAADSQVQTGMESSPAAHTSNSSFPAELTRLKHLLKRTFGDMKDGNWRPRSGSVLKAKSFSRVGSVYSGPVPLPASLFSRKRPPDFLCLADKATATVERLLETAED